MGVLANLLPGLRGSRATAVSGAMWLIAAYSLVAGTLQSTLHESAFLQSVWRDVQALPSFVVLPLVLAAIYLVGILLHPVSVWWSSKVVQLLTFVFVDFANREEDNFSTTYRHDALLNQLPRPILDYFASTRISTIARQAIADRVIDAFRTNNVPASLATTYVRYVDLQEDLESWAFQYKSRGQAEAEHFSRLEAEADLRLSLPLPAVFLGIALALQLSTHLPLMVALLFAIAMAFLGKASRDEADTLLHEAFRAGFVRSGRLDSVTHRLATMGVSGTDDTVLLDLALADALVSTGDEVAALDLLRDALGPDLYIAKSIAESIRQSALSPDLGPDQLGENGEMYYFREKAQELKSEQLLTLLSRVVVNSLYENLSLSDEQYHLIVSDLSRGILKWFHAECGHPQDHLDRITVYEFGC